MVSRRLIYKFLLDFVYPNRCPICGSFIKWDELLCKVCESKLPFHEKTLCERCGKDKCLDHDSLHFDSIYTLMRYEDICVKAIHQLKDDRQLNFAEYSAKPLGNVLRENGIAQQADIITSVPMHRSKRRKRGYDQAQKLAHFTAAELGINENYRLLGRTKDTAEQHTLTASERKTHAEEIYFSLPDHADIKGKNILLFDDVYTTGSTLNVCSGLLKNMGAKNVFCAAIATTLLDEKHKE